MGFEWKAAEDLEDLIYECKEVSASERYKDRSNISGPHHEVWFFAFYGDEVGRVSFPPKISSPVYEA